MSQTRWLEENSLLMSTCTPCWSTCLKNQQRGRGPFLIFKYGQKVQKYPQNLAATLQIEFHIHNLQQGNGNKHFKVTQNHHPLLQHVCVRWNTPPNSTDTGVSVMTPKPFQIYSSSTLPPGSTESSLTEKEAIVSV